MLRKTFQHRSVGMATIASFISLGVGTRVWADPLPGELLKFQQLPLGDLQTNPNTPASGHDEVSTATLAPGTNTYTGQFAADDFSDNVTSPIVDVGWWGSYLNSTAAPPPVQQFLISFESDVPGNSTAGTFSHPGKVLSSEVVSAGALSPQSGTFTEQAVGSYVPGPDGQLYDYNAELANPFPEQAGTIYWLKIVALDAISPTGNIPFWGWHNRDYTVPDSFAAPQTPGETNLGSVASPVWHFQDDAVSGVLSYTTGGIPQEGGFSPLDYNTTSDGFSTTSGVVPPSEDLAFDLYYAQVPEPIGLPLLGLGMFLFRRNRRNNFVSAATA
jgi:hypothetical protein